MATQGKAGLPYSVRFNAIEDRKIEGDVPSWLSDYSEMKGIRGYNDLGDKMMVGCKIICQVLGQ